MLTTPLRVTLFTKDNDGREGERVRESQAGRELQSEPGGVRQSKGAYSCSKIVYILKAGKGSELRDGEEVERGRK